MSVLVDKSFEVDRVAEVGSLLVLDCPSEVKAPVLDVGVEAGSLVLG